MLPDYTYFHLGPILSNYTKRDKRHHGVRLSESGHLKKEKHQIKLNREGYLKLSSSTREDVEDVEDMVIVLGNSAIDSIRPQAPRADRRTRSAAMAPWIRMDLHTYPVVRACMSLPCLVGWLRLHYVPPVGYRCIALSQ